MVRGNASMHDAKMVPAIGYRTVIYSISRHSPTVFKWPRSVVIYACLPLMALSVRNFFDPKTQTTLVPASEATRTVHVVPWTLRRTRGPMRGMKASKPVRNGVSRTRRWEAEPVDRTTGVHRSNDQNESRRSPQDRRRVSRHDHAPAKTRLWRPAIPGMGHKRNLSDQPSIYQGAGPLRYSLTSQYCRAPWPQDRQTNGLACWQWAVRGEATYHVPSGLNN
ncbi:hypothetical protein EDB85DRAFT_1024068 [Lactarius pseudohatsudake]|nr:hypothetical protein EDB85DRAFT_1024068 [Lactarius pseudohatsudake]